MGKDKRPFSRLLLLNSSCSEIKIYYIFKMNEILLIITLILIVYISCELLKQTVINKKTLYKINSYLKDNRYSNNSTNNKFTINTITIEPLLVKINNPINQEYFIHMVREAKALMPSLKQKKIGLTDFFRKANAIPLDKLVDKCPYITNFYMTDSVFNLLDGKLNNIKRTPLNDQNSIGLLYYHRPDDHINWHYDYNYYFGNRYTALLCLKNRNKKNGLLSCSKLKVSIDGKTETIMIAENQMIFFNGSKIKHMVTKSCQDDERIMLTMTYCDICQKNPFMSFYETIQKLSFYH